MRDIYNEPRPENFSWPSSLMNYQAWGINMSDRIDSNFWRSKLISPGFSVPFSQLNSV